MEKDRMIDKVRSIYFNYALPTCRLTSALSASASLHLAERTIKLTSPHNNANGNIRARIGMRPERMGPSEAERGRDTDTSRPTRVDAQRKARVRLGQ